MFYSASKLLWVAGATEQPARLRHRRRRHSPSCSAGAKSRGWLLYPGAAALLMISVLPVGQWLLVPLENRFPAPAEPPRDIDGIVVLGGGVDLAVSKRRGMAAFGDTGERFISLVELARRYPDARVLFSGGPGWLTGSDLTEAAIMRDFVRSQGLDEARVMFEDRARNTYENALLAKALAAPQPGERWLLVTSAVPHAARGGRIPAGRLAGAPVPGRLPHQGRIRPSARPGCRSALARVRRGDQELDRPGRLLDDRPHPRPAAGAVTPAAAAQCAMITGSSAAPRMWLVAPPKIIWRSRLWV